MHEYTLLEALHAQGGDVPAPIAHADNALLMELIGDEHGAAPTLNDVDVPRDEAQKLFERVLFNVELLLSMGWVHGDLSAYNMMYPGDRIVLIDFPQVAKCNANPRARGLFGRDIERIAQYFEGCGLTINAPQLAKELWLKHVPEPPA
jgi:RIO kinase 1